jgi:DNA-binding transcriptional ArsR family regulator
MDELSAAFTALSDPTRRRIVARLAHGEATVAELRRPLSMSAPAVSKHLRVLETVGLIERRRSGRNQVCRLRAETLVTARRWLETQTAFWENALVDHLEAERP